MAELEKSWYVKYRPRTIEEYSGPHIKRIVAQRFKDRASFPHTIYINGPRGTGKTTFARLISKYYLCQNPNEDGSPCNSCAACEEINETLIGGESGIETAGVTEVDATTANGKEAIQEIIEEAIIAPMYTDYKIIIFDECHMITKQAQNSLLKILEDIPAHLVCIFCTTDDEQVLQTIKSRMQLTLEAKKQSIGDMTNRLMQICQMEKLNPSPQALEVIAKKGDRVPRECINILETIAKNYDGEITIDNIKEYLGDTGSELYIKYFEAANSDMGAILKFIYDLRIKDIKLKAFINGLMEFALDALYIMHSINLEDYPKEYISNIKKLFDNYNVEEFDMLLQVLEDAERRVDDNNDKKNEVTLTVTAMRLAKIELLARGLADAQETAIAENKISMVEHSKMLNKTQEQVSEQLKMAVTPATLSDSFKDLAVVSDNFSIDAPISLDGLISEMQKPVEFKKPLSTGIKEIDDFFDN